VELIVYGFGQRSTYAAYFYKIIYARRNHSLEPAKLT
jgi:hypothetical protein